MTPEISVLISGVIFMTKYTKEIKLAIYHERGGTGTNRLTMPKTCHHTVVERIANRCCYTHLLLFFNPIAKIVVSQDSHNTPLQ